MPIVWSDADGEPFECIYIWNCKSFYIPQCYYFIDLLNCIVIEKHNTNFCSNIINSVHSMSNGGWVVGREKGVILSINYIKT